MFLSVKLLHDKKVACYVFCGVSSAAWLIRTFSGKSTNLKSHWNGGCFRIKCQLTWSTLWRKSVLTIRCCLRPCGPLSTAHFLNWHQRYRRKSLNNLWQEKIAKSAVHRTKKRRGSLELPEFWSSCVQVTFSNLNPKLQKDKYCMQFVLSHSTFQRYYFVKDACLQALRSKALCPVLLARRKFNSKLVF